MQKIRIVILSFGHVDSIVSLFTYLKRKTIEVDLVFCFSLNKKSESVLNFENVPIETGFQTHEKVKNIIDKKLEKYLVDLYSIGFFIYYNQKLRSIRNFFLSIKLANKLQKYDIIQINGMNGVLPLLIFFLRKKKLIFTIHDLKLHSGEKSRSNFNENLIKFLIKRKRLLVIQNRFDYEWLCNKYSNRRENFTFIPFGKLEIYREYANPMNNADTSDILFFGRISPYKGLDYLIDALQDLNNKGLKLKTIIAGQGASDIWVKDLKKIGVKQINRYISNEELADLIVTTKIVVCPYIDATQSGVAMTAFAFNKPVIATTVGGFIDVIKQKLTGILVRPGDSTQLAEAILYLIKNENVRNNMSISIDEFNQNSEFSWNRISEKYINLYNSIKSIKKT